MQTEMYRGVPSHTFNSSSTSASMAAECEFTRAVTVETSRSDTRGAEGNSPVCANDATINERSVGRTASFASSLDSNGSSVGSSVATSGCIAGLCWPAHASSAARGPSTLEGP
jgi:hypothetical protein